MILIACANSFGEALKFVDESFYKEKDFMIQVVFFSVKTKFAHPRNLGAPKRLFQKKPKGRSQTFEHSWTKSTTPPPKKKKSLTASLLLKSYQNPIGTGSFFLSHHFSGVNELLNFAVV